MRTKHKRMKAVWAATCLAALAVLAFAGSASAKLTGEFTRFEQCPFSNLEVKKCIYSPTEGGEVVLGTKKVPITRPRSCRVASAKRTPKPASPRSLTPKTGSPFPKHRRAVPGGLLGIVPPEKSPRWSKHSRRFSLKTA